MSTLICQHCHLDIEAAPRHGRLRLYCSNNCRWAAYRKRRLAKIETNAVERYLAGDPLVGRGSLAYAAEKPLDEGMNKLTKAVETATAAMLDRMGLTPQAPEADARRGPQPEPVVMRRRKKGAEGTGES